MATHVQVGRTTLSLFWSGAERQLMVAILINAIAEEDQFTVDEAEALANALLQLVQLARKPAKDSTEG